MQLDRFDVLLVHDCDIKTHSPSRQPEVFDAAMHGAYRALVRLRDEGIVRAIGVGVNDSSVCLDAISQADLDCVLLAGQYNIACQDALRTVLPAASSARWWWWWCSARCSATGTSLGRRTMRAGLPT
jgi:D-threo-aldose 1-dehydrogenase